MVGNELNVLSAFLAVAEDRSFTKASKRLGVSPSALSHAIRGLEERVGGRLLSRTTRSVSPTDAGEQLIAQLSPALADIHAALEEPVALRLLSRTTRSVSPTDAGEQLIAHLRPALGDITATLEQISRLRDRPAGRGRLGGPAPGAGGGR